MKMSFAFLFLSILILTRKFESSRGESTEKWIAQPQDHFDSNNHRTWFMRYYENDEFSRESGPIFIMIGGEYEITPALLEAGFMFEMARIHGAMMYITEHRYYGRSHPVPDTSFSNLRYLSIRQALADIAVFIEEKKEESKSFNAFIIVFGESYAGNLAAWMRVEYPNLVQGALASSAPVHIKADFFELFEAVADSYRRHDEDCAINIKEGFSAIEGLLKGGTVNSTTLQNDFNLCDEPDLSEPSEMSLLMLSLARVFGYAVIYNIMDGSEPTSLANLCTLMIANEATPSYYKLAEVLRNTLSDNIPCININYNQIVGEYAQTSWELQTVGVRLWMFQSCTELGYHQTSSSPHSIFGSLFPLQFYMNMCKDLFTKDYNPDILYTNIQRINHRYNSKLSDADKIIFTNGDLDPWRLLSVLSDLNPDSPSIRISGASHCGFLQLDGATNTDSLRHARCIVSSIIFGWHC